MRWLVDEAYPEIPVVRVVMDNLNTDRPASLYETFPAPEARRIAKRLDEIRWLQVVERLAIAEIRERLHR